MRARLGHLPALDGAQHGGFQLRAKVGQRGVAIQARAVREATRPRKDRRHCTRARHQGEGFGAWAESSARAARAPSTQAGRWKQRGLLRWGCACAQTRSGQQNLRDHTKVMRRCLMQHVRSQTAGSRVDAPGLVDVGRPFWCSRQCRVTVPARTSPRGSSEPSPSMSVPRIAVRHHAAHTALHPRY